MIHLKTFMSCTLRMTHKSKLLLAVLLKPYLNTIVLCLLIFSEIFGRRNMHIPYGTVRGVLDVRESKQTEESYFLMFASLLYPESLFQTLKIKRAEANKFPLKNLILFGHFVWQLNSIVVEQRWH